MDFLCKKTTELSQRELSQIADLFEEVFKKPRPTDVILNQYIYNPLGYSYHGLIVDNGKIVGLNTFVPSYYLALGKRVKCANSIDSMVSKPYRDLFNFMDMLNAAYVEMKRDDVVFVLGYPNDTSYPILTKSKLMRDIGKMNIFCLPYRIGGVKPSLAFLNWASMAFCGLFVGLCGLFASDKEACFRYEKEAETYDATRYKRFDGQYDIVERDGCTFMFKIREQEGVRTAFIIDVKRKSPKAFNTAVKYIIKNHGKEFDLLLYPGCLPFGNASMIKMPRKAEPKNFYVTGRELKKGVMGNDVWHIESWDTNLSNYDLI